MAYTLTGHILHIYIYRSEGFALTGYDISGCMDDGAWMLWENSSIVVVAVAHPGLGGWWRQEFDFLNFINEYIRDCPWIYPKLFSPKSNHKNAPPGAFVWFDFLNCGVGEPRIRLFPRNQITKMRLKRIFVIWFLKIYPWIYPRFHEYIRDFMKMILLMNRLQIQPPDL